jgi:hypothetical protein
MWIWIFRSTVSHVIASYGLVIVACFILAVEGLTLPWKIVAFAPVMVPIGFGHDLANLTDWLLCAAIYLPTFSVALLILGQRADHRLQTGTL